MATYKGINGYAVQTVASDPSPGDPGQVFYNTTAKSFEYTTQVQGAWATGGNLSTSRAESAGTGEGSTQNAAGIFGGNTNATEEYDGTSWTAGASLNVARNAGTSGGAGSQTAAVFASGGGPPTAGTATEEFTGGPVNVNKTISFS